MAKKLKHVMVDLETLGTTADACILSIGAVKFDLDTAEIDDGGFYTGVSIDSNVGRRIQEGTVAWWMKQGASAQTVFHEPTVKLDSALIEFSEWLGDAENYMWSNGADFDLPMLAHAYTSFGLPIPWQFWNNRCYRTYKNLPGAKNLKVPYDGVKHNALFDAMHQAKHLQAIHLALFRKK